MPSLIKACALAALILLVIRQDARWPAGSMRSPFEQWQSASGLHGEVAAYRDFLRRHGVAEVLPMPELLSARRDWRRCRVSAWQLPPRAAWPAMLPTLRLVKQLRDSGLLRQAQVTSSYRDAALNHCAGGRPASRHLLNAALDIRLSPDVAPAERQALCRFWLRHGREHRMGLGLYRGGQIHLDTGGYRQWQPGLAPGLSPCAKIGRQPT